MRQPGQILLALLAFAAAPALACAHGLGVDWKLRDNQVEVEAFYDDDTPAIKAKVQVVGIDDKVVASGVTDTEGKWTFAAPSSGKYEIRVDAGAGHRAKKALVVPPRDSEDPAPPVADGQTRAEFTRIPWLNIMLGMALIAVLAIAGIALLPLLRKPRA